MVLVMLKDVNWTIITSRLILYRVVLCVRKKKKKEEEEKIKKKKADMFLINTGKEGRSWD